MPGSQAFDRLMNYNPVILTLDAGGTNFMFSAIQERKTLFEPKRYDSNADNLKICIETLITGFRETISNLEMKPAAISFSFPGPADYINGIIGDLPNFQAFRGGVPLGSILEREFKIPVFINNDGDLFAYGEATSGYLPFVNEKLNKSGSLKQFRNLIGITLGTGIGAGIVINKQLLVGDNSCAAEIHNTINGNFPDWNCEESVSTRAIQRVYAEQSNLDFNQHLLPKEIYKIAKGNILGNRKAALKSFESFGRALGNAICNLVSLIDGLVVIGGGITAAWDLFGKYTMNEINRPYRDHFGVQHDRLSLQVFDLTDERNFSKFSKGNVKSLPIPGSNTTIEYDSSPRTGLAISKLGASTAIMIGAYDFALAQLSNSKK